MTDISLSTQQVADLAGGRVVGDGGQWLSGVAPLDRAGPTDLSFLTSGKYLGAFHRSQAGAVLVPDELASEPGPATRVVVSDPARALATVLHHLFPQTPAVPGVDATARLGAGVRLGDSPSIGPMVVLGKDVIIGDRVVIGAGSVVEDGVEIGDDTVLGPRVVCCSGARLGQRVRVKAGAVLGGVGYGFTMGADGHEAVPHIGRCVIEDDVHIGSNTCIDRGSIGDTVVGAGTKIDNLVQLGHNVRVGRRCLIMAQVGVAGSSRLGDGVVLAGQVGVAGHLTLGDGARLAAQSGVSSDIPPGEDWGGYPARPNRDWLRSTAVLYRIAPQMRELEAMVRERRADA